MLRYEALKPTDLQFTLEIDLLKQVVPCQLSNHVHYKFHNLKGSFSSTWVLVVNMDSSTIGDIIWITKKNMEAHCLCHENTNFKNRLLSKVDFISSGVNFQAFSCAELSWTIKLRSSLLKILITLYLDYLWLLDSHNLRIWISIFNTESESETWCSMSSKVSLSVVDGASINSVEYR